ncbi:MAG TPA: hypothetical protein VLF66_12905, partial [Thermoanaerobaculia bacterium]|nr:hypothetical protein [Thermoanaerobaculia bacterium]
MPELSLRAHGSRVYLTYIELREEDVGRQAGEEPPAEPAARVYRSVAQIDLRALLEPVIIPDVFDSILVADDVGEVLFQVGEPELKANSVRPLMASPGGDREDDTPAEDVTGSALSFDDLRRTTGMVKRKIGGNEYRVFSQPISLELRAIEGREAPAPTEWSVCGIVSSDRLLSSGVATSPVLLFLLVLLFPAGLVSWPFLKLWLISPRQRFTRLDVAFLLFATVLGLCLSTLLVLDLLFLWTTDRTIDDELEQLSAALDKSFRQELVRGYVQLEAFDDERLLSGVSAKQLQSRIEREDDGGSEDQAEEALDLELLCAYPWFRSVFRADEKGKQKVKWPLYREATLANDIRDRGYFDCALRVARGNVPPRGAGEALESPPPRSSFAGSFTLRTPSEGLTGAKEPPCPVLPKTPPAEVTLCLEPLLDRTTGQDRMVLSVARESREGDPKLPVAALVARPLSLTYPILSPGFGFALIEPGGRVLSHSDPRRNLTESFLKASDEDQLLSSVIDARREGGLDLVYQGRRRRAYVRPIDGLPWTLITFRSTRDLRLRNFELVYDFLNPLVVYTALVNLIFALAVAFAPGRWLRHLWPSWRYLALYRRIVVGGIPLIAVFAVVLALGERRTLSLAAFGLPFLALVLIVLGRAVELRKRRDEDRAERAGEARGSPAGGEAPGETADGSSEPGAGWLRTAPLWAACGLALCATLHAWTWGTAAPEVTFLALVVWLWSDRFRRRRSNFEGKQRRISYSFALQVLLFVL